MKADRDGYGELLAPSSALLRTWEQQVLLLPCARPVPLSGGGRETEQWEHSRRHQIYRPGVQVRLGGTFVLFSFTC